ncbi:MAG TPA: hypothetical protein PKU82_04510 [Bacteroidia bacterium]|nr:hypothetical protein [Bacteroidia bacterium]HOZ90860.1 hypothetical protein [Bacteroidia bacterium]HRB52039.1 hypothetical protein [Bacteroidia bacterium]
MFIVALIFSWFPSVFISLRFLLAKVYANLQKKNEAENNLESLLIINTVMVELETLSRYFLWYGITATVLILIIKYV